jgi:nucleoside phosphorylase
MPETHPPVPAVLVLTTLAPEAAAVRAHIEDQEELVHRDGTRVERGRLPGTAWYLVLAELGEGTRTAALTTQLIEWLRPEAVLFVGVAAGLKDDITPGDVVVGTRVYGIHGGKWASDGFLARPESWPGSNALVQAARSAVRDMPGVRAHFKPVASGDVVLADVESEIVKHVRAHYNDAVAIEMEGSGAAHAAHLSGQLDTLVIQGIGDRANSDGSRNRAAAQAAAVAVEALRKHRPRAGSAESALSYRSRPRSPKSSEEGPHSPGDHIGLRHGTFHGPVIGKQR